MLQPAQSVMHRKPPALRLPVPSLLCHQAHTSPIKEFPALQGTHDHRRLCPSLSLNYSFFWACLVCLAAPQAQPWGPQQRGHSGDIQRCAKPLPSPALRAQTCYPRNHLQSSAGGNPGNSVVSAISKDSVEAETFLDQHPAPGEELVLMQSSLEMRPCCTCQQL